MLLYAAHEAETLEICELRGVSYGRMKKVRNTQSHRADSAARWLGKTVRERYKIKYDLIQRFGHPDEARSSA
jgi:hypothetical protein